MNQVHATRVRPLVTVEKMQPLDGRVLVRRALRPEKTAGGIILPEQARNISQTGIVVKLPAGSVKSCRACGKKLPLAPVSVGDVVVFSQYAASPCVASEETDLVFVRDCDLLAIVEA